MYVCMYVCMYACIFIKTYSRSLAPSHTHTHTPHAHTPHTHTRALTCTLYSIFPISFYIQALDRVSNGRTVIKIAHRLNTIVHPDIVAVLHLPTLYSLPLPSSLFNVYLSVYPALM